MSDFLLCIWALFLSCSGLIQCCQVIKLERRVRDLEQFEEAIFGAIMKGAEENGNQE